MALLFAPFAINICYTAGWFVEALLSLFLPNKTHKVGLWLFRVGLTFSLFVVTFPAVFWAGYLLLQRIVLFDKLFTKIYQQLRLKVL